MKHFFAFIIVAFAAIAPAQAQPIAEAMFVSIGGIDQWITIKGDDRDNPVVLFLHGGPGDALTPIAGSMFAGWEHDFTLVQWDQRGAGRTFTKNGSGIDPAVTVERMVQDGIEISGYLTHHLHAKKLILLGMSWGSVLGIHMAHARPDLFYAYVGMAQLTNWQKDLAVSYARVLELAHAANDTEAVTALTALGAPPWNTVRTWPLYRKWQRAYQAKRATAPLPHIALDPAYASAEEQAQNEAADDLSFEHFWGMTLSGPLTQVDLPALGPKFAIPIFVIQGEEDLTAAPAPARDYVAGIEAPEKGFYLVPGTGHSESAEMLALAHKVMMERVRPLAVAR